LDRKGFDLSRYVQIEPNIKIQYLKKARLLNSSVLLNEFPFSKEDHNVYYYYARNSIYNGLKYLGAKNGDNILVPSYHHGTEIEAIRLTGLDLKFYRIDQNMQLDEEDLLSKIDEKTRFVFIIHYIGFPQFLDNIIEACKKNDIALIEDCALALFSKDGNLPLGIRGDMSVFCIYKTLPVPNGGLVHISRGINGKKFVFERPDNISVASRICRMSLNKMKHSAPKAEEIFSKIIQISFGNLFNAANIKRNPPGTNILDPKLINWGISEISKTIIRNANPERIVQTRRRNYNYMIENLPEEFRRVFPVLKEGVCPLFYPLPVRNKDNVMNYLKNKSMETINFWSWEHPLIKKGDFPEADRLRESIVELPIHQDIHEEDLTYMCSTIKNMLHSNIN
jgi:dTDP-4-amino-4,6-dideoxygalactose transaminase